MLGEFPIVANVPVTDLERARTFYSGVLGLELATVEEGESLHFQCGQGTWLEVYRTRAGVGVGHTEAGFQVTGIEQLVADLRNRGVVIQEYDLGEGMATVDGIVTLGDSKMAWFTDPEGNIIGLYQSLTADQ
jgi:catechol 2,3-dioxygenase-like lactoylglutathione lyase family enzyme